MHYLPEQAVLRHRQAQLPFALDLLRKALFRAEVKHSNAVHTKIPMGGSGQSPLNSKSTIPKQ